jgi:hypothetical protein
VTAGALTYVASALLIARTASADFLGLLRKSFRPRSEPGA